jgi:hypothetical protein
VNVCPATLSVVLRPGPGLAPTENVTAPAPFPVAPDVIVIQSAVVDTCQPHPPLVITWIVPFPPETSNTCSVGAMLNEHPPACSTVN